MLVRLIYASRATGPIQSEMLTRILDASRRHNHEQGITGVLCVCQGDVFLQVLEGGRDPVNRLYAKLLADARHRDVTLLDYAEIDERRFCSWRMGRVDMEKLNPGLVLKYSDKPLLDPFSISGHSALALLEELISTASVVGGN